MLVFWSAVCSHYVRYDDYFNSFAGRHPQLGFAAIASRLNETDSQMVTAVQDRRLTFPILRDKDGSIARLLSHRPELCAAIPGRGRQFQDARRPGLPRVGRACHRVFSRRRTDRPA
jgi:hypothetical protein